ncbi:MAG: FAD-dependent oxidoreductase [Solobacterium sp.]|nr:FAD-dependent oxidoreductase [Solobacterium sp.]
MRKVQCVIIGGGSAGLAAAIELKKNGIDDILVLEKGSEVGGILNQCIHNGFGLHEFKEELSGPAYAERFANQAKELGIPIECQTTVTAFYPDKTLEVSNTDGYEVIQADAVVLAMGCQERTSGQIQIPGMRPQGVYTAGTAQRYVNLDGYQIGKKVFILGSGDIGLIMARRMTLEGAKVLGVAELMPYSNGLQRNIVQCLKDYDIPLYLSHTVTNIEGFPRLEKVTISEVDENRQPIPGTEKVFEVDTLLLSVGLVPDNTLTVEAGINLDLRTRGIEVNELCESHMPGVFACGNVLHVHDLVDYVTAEGRKAGLGAVRYLKGELPERKGFTTKAGNGVSYVLPQRVDYPSEDESVEFSFRVRTPYKNATVVVKNGEEEVKRIKKLALLPAEMEKVILPKEVLTTIQNELVIEIEEGQ